MNELSALIGSWGEKSFRARQIAHAVYHRCISQWDEMTDLPLSLRERLGRELPLTSMRVAAQHQSEDGASKLLFQLHDDERIETVHLPYEDRVSVCVSSQVGCPAGCRFCATAQGGLARNLTRGEIVEQVLAVQKAFPERRVSHCVFMGMGEPLFNYDEVVGAIRVFTGEFGMSARKITVSTVGVPEGIRRLSQEELPITLALSLHAPNDELRAELIPTANRWSMGEILAACGEYASKTKRNLTFEYLLIGGVNDSVDAARETAQRLRGLPGNVNLIPFNYVDTQEGYRRPDQDAVKRFRSELEKAGRTVTQRMERGNAVSAACGQLRRLTGTFRGRTRQIALQAQ